MESVLSFSTLLVLRKEHSRFYQQTFDRPSDKFQRIQLQTFTYNFYHVPEHGGAVWYLREVFPQAFSYAQRELMLLPTSI
jgi:hypothetical protein